MKHTERLERRRKTICHAPGLFLPLDERVCIRQRCQGVWRARGAPGAPCTGTRNASVPIPFPAPPLQQLPGSALVGYLCPSQCRNNYRTHLRNAIQPRLMASQEAPTTCSAAAPQLVAQGWMCSSSCFGLLNEKKKKKRVGTKSRDFKPASHRVPTSYFLLLHPAPVPSFGATAISCLLCCGYWGSAPRRQPA